MNKTIAHSLTRLASNKPTTWSRYLGHVQIAINSRKNMTTGYSPFYLRHSTEMCLGPENHQGQWI